MNREIVSAVLAVLLVASGVGPVGSVAGATQSDCSFPVTSTDATGTEVTVEQKPERVVTLAPSAAQTMWEIGGKSQVVGVSKYASYLKGAESRTNVSGAGQQYVVVEKVVAANPDLVLAPNVISNETVQKLRDAGLTVYKFGFTSSIEDIYAKTELIGQLTGNCEGASETVAWMEDRISTVKQAVEGEDRPRALYTFFGYTAGEGTFIHELITTAGAKNVAAAANISGYQKINPEVVVERNPEWLLLNSDSPTVPKSEAYNGTYAVQHNQTLVLNSSYISQPAPRVVYPIVKMAKAFHPEAYAEANATTTTTAANATTTATETTTTETTTAATETTEAAVQDATSTTAESTGSTPGFGVTAAVAALAGAALLARRR